MRGAASDVAPVCTNTMEMSWAVGLTIIVSFVLAAISMGVLIGLIFYVQRVMHRINAISTKLESQHAAMLEEISKLRVELAVRSRDDSHEVGSLRLGRRVPSLGGQSMGSDAGWAAGYESEDAREPL